VIHQLLETFFVLGDVPANIEKGTHIRLFVIASYLVATFGSYTGVSVANLLSASPRPPQKQLLRVLGSFGYGGGFWCMQFLGLLSYTASVNIAVNPWHSFIALLASVGITYALLWFTRHEGPPSPKKALPSGILMGIGIGILNTTAITSWQMEASLRFLPEPFILSIVAAIAASQAGLWIVYSHDREGTNRRILWRILAALVLGAGMWGSYYLNLHAVVLSPFENSSFAPHSHQLLAVTALIVVVILLFILTFAISNRIFLTVGCGALFALPLVLIIHQAVSALNFEIETLQKEQKGLAYHGQLLEAFRHLQDVRDLTFAVRSGASELNPLRLESSAKFEAKMEALDQFKLESLECTRLKPDWQEFKSDLSFLESQTQFTPDQQFKAYSATIHTLSNYMNHVADTTNISLDPEVGKNPLLSSVIHIIPRIYDYATLTRGHALTFALSSPEQWNEEGKFALKASVYHLESHDVELGDIVNRAEALSRNTDKLFALNEEVIEPKMRKLMAHINDVVSQRTPAMSAVETYAFVTDIVQSFGPVYDKPIASFQKVLKERESSRIFTRNLMLYSSVAAFLGFISLFVFLNRSLLKTERAQILALQTQKELAVRLLEKERLERQMQDYTDRLELSRFDVMAANTKLKDEEAKIRGIMDNVSEGIVVINEFGIIQTFNKAAERVFDYTSAEAVEQSLSFLVPPENKSEPEARIKKYVETKGGGLIGVEREIVGQRKDGTRFPMLINTSEVVLGKTRLFIALVRDITPQKEKESDLLQMKEKAEAANKTKSEFLANMSHELRTPLNSVFGMTRLLLGTKLSTEQQDLANTVLASSNNLMEIVNDILDLSKIEAGEVKLEAIGFDPRAVLHSIVRSLAHAAREKNVPIVRLYEKETLPYVVGDPLRLGRIITNLLSNAIKYTEEGHIEVRANTRQIGDTQIELRCEVTDTGIGIPSEKLDSVFDKFVQADTSTTRKYGGTGLGLAITRELVLMMGGKIGVTSEVGMGSAFWFTIPFEVTNKLHEEKLSRQQKTSSGTILPEQARILVAEDHPMNQMLIKRLLAKFNISQYEIVSNGNEVLVAYGKGPWTAILMDCHMPEKNGYDATVAIRQIEKSTKDHIPVIAMTANAMVGDKEKCLQSGMDQYVSKPINIEELKEVLSQWIAFDDSNDKTGDTMPNTPAVDLTMLRTLTGGDAEIEKELMQTFVEQSDINLVALEANKSADGENTSWTEAAHMLKGGSGSIGAEELRQLCSEAQLYKGASFGREALFQKIELEYGRVKEHLRNEGLLS
jgi:PAS domain S-box-containing protein